MNLQLNDEELKEIINDFWLNFKHTCNNNYDEATKKTLNMALKLIFDHKTTDEWIQLLTEVEQVIFTCKIQYFILIVSNYGLYRSLSLSLSRKSNRQFLMKDQGKKVNY